jgi:hypothetical protein
MTFPPRRWSMRLPPRPCSTVRARVRDRTPRVFSVHEDLAGATRDLQLELGVASGKH